MTDEGAPTAEVKDLKGRFIRGGAAKVLGQGAAMALQLVNVVVLSRILSPEDFGLMAMVMSVIGVLQLLKDFGLSTATIQSGAVTHAQLTTLFWLNMLVGVGLMLLTWLATPAMVAFFREPRLLWIGLAAGVAFLFTGAGIQHTALLQRQMRFTALAAIETAALLGGIVVGVAMAWTGYGYWSLVGMSLANPALLTGLAWLSSRWVPGRPSRGAGVGPMIRVGGVITINSIVMYVAYNLDKVLIGRLFGSDALGLYSRSYQLANIPTSTLNAAVGVVSMSALSRVKDEPERLKKYFLGSYSVLMGLTLPITVGCGLFSGELVAVLLGPKWSEAAPIFLLLVPTILAFGMINPLWPFLVSQGLHVRSLKISLTLAPLVIASYFAGSQFGPKGVAAAFSILMVLWVVPHLAWAFHGTIVGLKDVSIAISRPLAAAVMAAAATHLIGSWLFGELQHWQRLLAGSLCLGALYAFLLLFVFGQRGLYLEIIKSLRGSAG